MDKDVITLIDGEKIAVKDFNMWRRIHQSIEHIDMAVDKYTPNDMLPSVDAIIVTPLFKYKEIATSLREKVDCSIVSLEELIGKI